MITKKVSPKGRSVRVTFELPKEEASERVAVVGDFNDWSEDKHMMKLDKKRGVWTKSVSFKPGETVEFRYLVDDERWLNDTDADSTKPTPYNSHNSVLEL